MATRMAEVPAAPIIIDTCTNCRVPIVLAAGIWANGSGNAACPAGTGHVPVSGTPITTPLRELLICMAEDAAMNRQPEPSAHCPYCTAATADRCDLCANDQALADEYDALKARIKAVTTDAAAVAALVELVGAPEGKAAA